MKENEYRKNENLNVSKRISEAEIEIEKISAKYTNLQVYSKVIRLQLNDKSEILQNHLSEEKDRREFLLTQLEQSKLKIISQESDYKNLKLEITNLRERYQSKHGDCDHAVEKISSLLDEREKLVKERQDVLLKYEQTKLELKHKLDYIKGSEQMEIVNRKKNLEKFEAQQN